MDSRTGKIYDLDAATNIDQLKDMHPYRLVELDADEASALKHLPEAERAEALALSRYIAQRKKLRAKCGAEVQNAFRNGYKAAVKDNQ